MGTGRSSSGYTIIEIMIVLAVSSALLISGLLLVGGQQRKTEFNQSVDNIQSDINQVINNVQTGYYQKTSNFSCSNIGGVPTFADLGSDNRGTNQDCILVGRAIQFAVNGDLGAYNFYNLAGLRLNSSNQPVTSINETLPTAISKGNFTNTNPNFTNDSTENKNLQYGLHALAMSYQPQGSPTHVSTSIVAFVTDFPSVNAGNLSSGSRVTNLYAINGTTTAVNLSPAVTQPNAVDAINAGHTVQTAANFVQADSVTICYGYGVTDNLFAVIRIGDSGSQLTTNLKFVNTLPSSGECS